MAAKRQREERDLETIEEELLEDLSPKRQRRKRTVDTIHVASEPFVSGKHHFSIRTMYVKNLMHILEMMREDAIMNFEVTSKGVQLYSLPFHKSVCVLGFLSPTYFPQCYEFTSKEDKPIVLPLNIQILYRNLQRFKNSSWVQSLTFTTGKGFLKMVGMDEHNQAVMVSKINTLNEKLEGLGINRDYPVMFRVNTEDFCQCIENMPKNFEIRMDVEAEVMRFEGKTVSDQFMVTLKLDKHIVQAMKDHEEKNENPDTSVANFHQSFLKSIFQPVLKGSKLNREITVGLINNAPLFCEYVVRDSLEDEQNSKVSTWIVPQFRKEFDGEEDED